MDNGEIIAELYSLRAGLSLIAQEGDKLKAKLSVAELEKTAALQQARMECDAKIARDSESVRRAESQAEARKKEIRDKKLRRVQDITTEIAVREAQIQKLKIENEEAAESAVTEKRRALDRLKPSESRDNYEAARSKYKSNKESLQKRVSERAAGDTAKCVFDVLFCVLHILTAVYECFGIYTLNINRYLFLTAFWVAVLIMVVECVFAKGYWSNLKNSNADLAVAVMAYIFYIANICILFVSTITMGTKPESYSRPTMITVVLVGSALAFAVTLWRTIRHFKRGCQMEYAKRAAMRLENKRLESSLKKAEKLDTAWAKYDSEKAEYDRVKDAAVLNIIDSSVQYVKEEDERARKEIEKIKADADSQIAAVKNALREKEKEHEEFKAAAQKQCESDCADIETQCQNRCRELTELHGKISSELWDTLVEKYGRLLDVRDWKILDLVIWQLETNRADTVKEALQLADREMQADRIMQSIKAANNEIGQRIHDSFGSLKSQLAGSFYNLAKGFTAIAGDISRQIERSSRLISGRIDESALKTAAAYESQLSGMLESNRNMERLFSETTLQTALLEKSNCSSDNLISAVNELRKKIAD